MISTVLTRTLEPAGRTQEPAAIPRITNLGDDLIRSLRFEPGNIFGLPIGNKLCPKLPLLDDLQREYGPLHESIRGFVGLQHLFGSTATLIDKLVDRRIRPEGVFLLGKPYSANRQVVRLLQFGHGYWVHPDSTFQPLDQPNDNEMDKRIRTTLAASRRWINRHDKNGRNRILLIDDGGRAIRMLHTPEFADICGRFTCVEQTRAGIRALNDLNLRLPVINVAESWVKLEHESPMIARSVIDELGKQLTGLERSGIPVGRRALIIGYGAIGRAVCAEMRCQGRQVEVYDRDEARLAQAVRDGYRIYNHLRTALARGGLVIGCTGTPVLDKSDHSFLTDGTILVSASSADVEFRGWQIRPHAEPLGRPQFWSRARLDAWNGSRPVHPGTSDEDRCPCFCLYRANFGDRRIYLVNGGFPVNFNGGIDPIVPEEIQLTRGLLYIGAIQSSTERSPGLHDLDDSSQHYLFNTYRRLTRQHQAGGVKCS